MKKDKDLYIKKLERKIHNQRLALRQTYDILEQRQAYRETPLRSMWFDKAIKLGQELSRLNKLNKNIKKIYEKYKNEYGFDREDTIPPDYVVIELWEAIKADIDVGH